MNRAFYTLLLTVLLLLPGVSCPAHSVNVFAHAENGIIKGEGYLSGGKKVVNGTVQIFAKNSNQLLLTMQTDDQGLFSFPIADLNQDNAADLLIVLNAGPGHRSEWVLNSDQYEPSGQSQKITEHTETFAESSENHAPAATPPLINIIVGIGCILGIGGIISFIKSRKRRKP